MHERPLGKRIQAVFARYRRDCYPESILVVAPGCGVTIYARPALAGNPLISCGTRREAMERMRDALGRRWLHQREAREQHARTRRGGPAV